MDYNHKDWHEQINYSSAACATYKFGIDAKKHPNENKFFYIHLIKDNTFLSADLIRKDDIKCCVYSCSSAETAAPLSSSQLRAIRSEGNRNRHSSQQCV